MVSTHASSPDMLFRFKKKKAEITAHEEAADSLKKDSYKNYAELLANAQTDEGLFNVHRVDTDLYFEIADSLFGRDMLIVNKISGVPEFLNGAGVNRGMSYEEQVVRFVKDTLYKKVWVVNFEPRVSSPAGDFITRSVKDNYREIVREYFPIETISDEGSVVIKVNKVFDGSEKSLNNVFDKLDFPVSARKELSRISSAKSFPTNIVVKSTLTAVVTDVPMSIDVTSNIVLLTEKPMTARFGDNRVGYFATPHIYFSDTQQRVEEREFIHRWRLEPHPQDVELYLNGELVEPQKQIVFYIDPATPAQWIPYIKKGVEQWNEAFERAGFKNAITALEVDPQRDSDFDIDDVRYSVITYAASETANAMGPSVVDPRSGEIIEADIIWWHNVMDLLHSWIRVQTGAVDPRARLNTLDADLMGDAIGFVSSHELGHSLGLKHNFGASYSIPVDSLRSKSFTDTNGTASSIMDYARFNYVAQPGDGIEQLTPKIGTYDKFAIEWGYRWLEAEDPHAELRQLDSLLRQHEDDPQYWYGEQNADSTDPRSQSEDLGNDVLKASSYGIANLKRMMPHLVEWTYREGELKFEAGRFLNSIIGQWQQYTLHVMNNIGGMYVDNIVYGRSGNRYTPVPARQQRACMKWLLEEAIVLPKWIFEDRVWQESFASRPSIAGLQEYSPLNTARNTQSWLMYNLVKDSRLLMMFEAEAMSGRGNVYTAEEMLGDVTRRLFTAESGASLDVYQRMAQKNYVDALIVASIPSMEKTAKKTGESGNRQHVCSLISEAPEARMLDIDLYLEKGLRTVRNFGAMTRVSEATSARRGELKEILAILNRRLNGGDKATRNHYYDLKLRIEEALGIN